MDNQAKWDEDFKAGWTAAKRAGHYTPPAVAYHRVQKRYGQDYAAGYAAYIDNALGAEAQPGVLRAQELGLC